uniref:DNA replication complex GINS protein SLD5 n=1 Tax=Strigamia maritima TaxID=126957 RepID=T1ISP2_STRMM
MDNILNESADMEDDDEEPMTSVESLAALEEAWLNEELSPELLEHKSELVECLQGQVKHMEENIARLTKGDLLISVHKMEIDRVNYIIRSYLKCRLKKIEQCSSHILGKEAQTDRDDRFSEAELQFTQEHLSSIEDHLKMLALQHMPATFKTFPEGIKKMATPKRDTYVFLKMNQSVPGLAMIDDTIEGGEEIVDLDEGSQHIMRYKSIAHLIKSREASLI